MATPSGNTTVIIGDREVFVVDSTYRPSLAREDIAQIRQWTDKPVRYLLNTHFHDDHNNGNKTYMDAFPSLAIVAQEETKKDMDLIDPGNIERRTKGAGGDDCRLSAGKGSAWPSINGRREKGSAKIDARIGAEVADLKARWFTSLPLSLLPTRSISTLATARFRYAPGAGHFRGCRCVPA